jgi:hypothetical protein
MTAWTDVEASIRARAEEGSNLLIAMQLYNAGGGTVESLTVDWDLDEADAALLLANVKRGWQDGRWKDRRVMVERRNP